MLKSMLQATRARVESARSSISDIRFYYSDRVQAAIAIRTRCRVMRRESLTEAAAALQPDFQHPRRFLCKSFVS